MDDGVDWFYGSSAKRKRNGDDSDDSFENEGSIKISKISTTPKRDSLVELSLGCFETFPKQRLAVEFMLASESLNKNLRVFSYELSGKGEGERRYLVTTLSRFWVWYSGRTDKHMYELLYEGHPCRLYFDLEFSKESNPDANEKDLFDHFCRTVQLVLKEIFSIDINPKKNFLVLDSSSETKYSAHVICHFNDGSLFPNSASLKSVCNILLEKIKIDVPHKLLDPTGTKEVPIFDPAVYTKNRNFRLFLSSKLGKDRVLRRSSLCQFYGERQPKDETIYYDSLCVPENFKKYPIISMSDFLPEDPVTKKIGNSSKLESVQEGCGPSPYPLLDDFLLMILRKWKSTAYFRQWKISNIDGKPETITYYPANCRYCFNINREHKSNGTYWVVNFKSGSFFQKCFDIECKGFSSNIFPLPDIIQATFKNDESTNSNDSFDSASGNISFLDDNKEIYDYFTNWDEVFES